MENLIRQKMGDTPPFQASKWIHLPLLLDLSSMELFLDLVKEGHLFCTSEIIPRGKERFSWEDFKGVYTQYIADLKRSIEPKIQDINRLFSASLTFDLKAAVAIDVAEDRSMVRPIAPLIQLQHHRMYYQEADQKFHSMVYGKEAISWGLQVSYPLIYHDINSGQAQEIDRSHPSLNSEVFWQIQRFVRHHTEPTTFLTNGEKRVTSIRMSKGCLSWINAHPHLKRLNYTVLGAE